MARTTSRELVDAVWTQLRADREVLALPVLSAVFSAAAGTILVVAALVSGVFTAVVEQGQPDAASVVWAFATTYVLTAIALFFQSAVIIAANARMDGQDPTLDYCLREATSRIPLILSWALLATTVNALLRGAQERGIGRFIARVAGLAWTVATFLALPVVILERVTPIAAVKASGRIISEKWGGVVRAGTRFGLRLGAMWLAIGLLLAAGMTVLSQGDTGTGGALIAVALIGMGVLGVVTSAVTGYFRVALYRYATGKPVPGVAPELLAGAFVTRGV